MAKKNTFYVRGTAYWAKVFGEPRQNNFNDYREHTIDLVVDEDGIRLFKELKVGDRLKPSNQTKGMFYTFKQKEFRADGVTKNDPIRVVDINNQPWPEGKLIGNGTKVDIKFYFQPASGAKKAGLYIKGIRVLDLVTYESQEFPPIESDDEYFAAAQDAGAKVDNVDDFVGDPIEDGGFEYVGDLDDDIPE